MRMVLSGVARVSRGAAGCGKQLLAQMLCGSNDKPVMRNRLDKLSTFGLLGHLKQPEVVQLIDALLIRGLLEQTEIEPFRPVVQLTARGRSDERDASMQSCACRCPMQLWRKIGGTSRNRKAAASPRVEPPAAGRGTCRPGCASRSRFPTATAARHEMASPQLRRRQRRAQPSHYWTWRLLAPVSRQTNALPRVDSTEEVVLDHALRAADGGLAIDARWFLSAELIATIRQRCGQYSARTHSPAFGASFRAERATKQCNWC